MRCQSDADEMDPMLPTRCAICDGRALQVSELAPLEGMATVVNGAGMCARHWANFAQGIANSYGLTLLRAEEAKSEDDA
jgi:hypothetical protein